MKGTFMYSSLLAILFMVAPSAGIEIGDCNITEITKLNESSFYSVSLNVSQEDIDTCNGVFLKTWTFTKQAAKTSNSKWELYWSVENFTAPTECDLNSLTSTEYIHHYSMDVCEYLKQNEDSLPYIITTSSEKFTVKLKLTQPGFVVFNIDTAHLCSDVYNLKEDDSKSLVITSPHYPDSYPDAVTCMYRFKTAKEKNLELYCDNFDVGEMVGNRWSKRCTDSFTVSKTEKGVLKNYCGNTLEKSTLKVVTSNGAAYFIMTAHNCEKQATGCQKLTETYSTGHDEYAISHKGFNCTVSLVDKSSK